MSENKKKTFAEKYPALDAKGIERQKAGQQATKTKYTAKALEIEKNFTAFGEVLDPIEWKDPNTEKFKTIAMVRRPTMKQMKEMVPPEMVKYVGKKAPKELEEKYAKFMYQKMSEMIAIPERIADGWEEYANPWFMRKFWQHIEDIVKMIEGESEGFLEPQ